MNTDKNKMQDIVRYPALLLSWTEETAERSALAAAGAGG